MFLKATEWRTCTKKILVAYRCKLSTCWDQ